jgi:hypothetical protein
MEKYIAGKRSMECKQKQLGGLVRNKIKHRKKYKIGKSPTPLGKITIDVTTTGINTCKKIFEFGQREVISFFTLVTNKGDHSIIYSK